MPAGSNGVIRKHLRSMDNTNKNFCIFLCGDVMTGRGIDQILKHPCDPKLYEPYVTDAREYVFLAEEANGKIQYPVSPNYIWGDALKFWQDHQPKIKIINLETAITKSNDYWLEKNIHYRMHPLNINVLTTANIDVCTLANNHILDWDYVGLNETISTLDKVGIKHAGAGENLTQAMQPVNVKIGPNKRILVFSVGTASSGVFSAWGATTKNSGVYYLPDLSHTTLKSVAENIQQYRQPDDLIIFSIHWGSNWGYEIPESFRSFAHGLIDIANVDVVFGHSSHHFRPIEIYRGKPILYGCGDFINDYEGISGYEEYRDDLTLMYFLYFDDESLQLKKMILVPLQINKFSLHTPKEQDCLFMQRRLNEISIGTNFVLRDGKFFCSV